MQDILRYIRLFRMCSFVSILKLCYVNVPPLTCLTGEAFLPIYSPLIWQHSLWLFFGKPPLPALGPRGPGVELIPSQRDPSLTNQSHTVKGSRLGTQPRPGQWISTRTLARTIRKEVLLCQAGRMGIVGRPCLRRKPTLRETCISSWMQPTWSQYCPQMLQL